MPRRPRSESPEGHERSVQPRIQTRSLAAPFLLSIPDEVEFWCADIFKQKNSFYRSLNSDSESLSDLARLEYIIRWSILLIRTRTAFRRLARRIILRRCERHALDGLDPITLDTIIQPVIVYDMERRSRYNFEAQSLMHHITNQLTQHSYGFTSSIAPRNPLTNLMFTEAQLISIHTQLRTHGRIHWTLGAYASVNYNLTTFKIMFETALRTTAIKKHVFRDYEGTAEEISDFIAIWGAYHKLTLSDVDVAFLTHTLTVIPHHSYLLCWRRLYLRALLSNITLRPSPSVLDPAPVALQKRMILYYSKILMENMRMFLDEAPKPKALSPSEFYAFLVGDDDDDDADADDEDEDEIDHENDY
jgi:hypothetical protein